MIISELDAQRRENEKIKRQIRALEIWKNEISSGNTVRGGAVGAIPSSASQPIGSVTTWTNASGSTRSQGDVVVRTATTREMTTTTTAADPTVIGVVDNETAVINGAEARVKDHGYQSVVNVVGAVAVGDVLIASTTAARGKSGGKNWRPGAFGVALSTAAGPGNGTVSAVLMAPAFFGLAFGDAAQLTIAAGVVTPSTGEGIYYAIETQAAAASDDLDTITAPAGSEPVLLIVRPFNGTHTVVLKNATGNIVCPGATDLTLADIANYALLLYDPAAGGWVVIAHNMATAGGGGGNSIIQYAFAPDAAPTATVVAGDQQGNIYHSGPITETARRLLVDCETAPGAAGLPITVQYGDTNSLDTVAVWTDIATITLSSAKSGVTAVMLHAAIPANMLIRMNVGVIVGNPADVTVLLEVSRPLTTTFSVTQYTFTPDAAPGVAIAAGNQQGNIVHSGGAAETATAIYIDCETPPGAAGLPITLEYGDTNSLDTVAVWTTIVSLTLSSAKSITTTVMANATIPADRLLRMNVGAIVGTPADATVTLETHRPTQ